MEDSMDTDIRTDNLKDGLSEDQRAYAEIVFGTKDFAKDPRFIEWRRRLAAGTEKTAAILPERHDVC